MAMIYITVVVLYALFVAICLFRLKLSNRRKKDIVGKGNTIPETGNLKTDIVEKASMRNRRQRHSYPNRSHLRPPRTKTKKG